VPHDSNDAVIAAGDCRDVRFTSANQFNFARPPSLGEERFKRTVVCTENLTTGVVVMKSAQDGA
jgi:hypothetical protein